MFKKLAIAAALSCFASGASAAVVDAFDLDVGTTAGTNSNIILELGRTYTLTVSGTFFLGNNAKRHLADAEFFNLGNNAPIDGLTNREIGVGVDGADIDLGAFNPSNVYSTKITGTGAAINVYFQDSAANTLGDNTGSLQVELSTVPLPAGGALLLAGLGALALTRRKRS